MAFLRLHARVAQLNQIEVITQTEALYTLRVLTNNTDALVDEITTLASSNKSQFQHAPVILEIEHKNFQANELAVLIEILAQNEMVAVGIRSRKQELIDFAKFSGLAVFGKSLSPSSKSKIKTQAPQQPTPSAPNPHQDKIYQAPKIITNKVYSFQQVIAEDRDLVLLAKVKAGADVMSFGSISAYKEVQGSLFAGIQGDDKATIFVQSFNAELVSIAGVYKKFDVVPTKLYARSVMIDLSNGQLRFQII
ncbi:septum site-determining protein MinC [Candidatus Thioglobus autotrophicus]|jgi:septum site-determining protein MinC|uniref:septum site-determining protein MinC n=1 Tax=Candidatus Thioglobus autotrophicus TaxID=1705394 RepID=UPI0009EA6F49|nr:septum site-determining protein MinC [Candidatus Thioglobus autotrophicus]WPE16948.1 septum site-determining protein MinC [Candidatus Thioglobus autotrophicus]WPE18501.1 septum site-determining protein MinC [Candidatus Thioglobus autotrophicus]